MSKLNNLAMVPGQFGDSVCVCVCVEGGGGVGDGVGAW